MVCDHRATTAGRIERDSGDGTNTPHQSRHLDLIDHRRTNRHTYIHTHAAYYIHVRTHNKSQSIVDLAVSGVAVHAMQV